MADHVSGPHGFRFAFCCHFACRSCCGSNAQRAFASTSKHGDVATSCHGPPCSSAEIADWVGVGLGELYQLGMGQIHACQNQIHACQNNYMSSRIWSCPLLPPFHLPTMFAASPPPALPPLQVQPGLTRFDSLEVPEKPEVLFEEDMAWFQDFAEAECSI